MMTYLGLTVGPSLGGWLTLQFGWRAAFFINLPIGLLAIWLSIYFIPRDAPADQPEPFDWAGAATFMIGLVVLMLALNQGHAWGWTSPIILTMLFVAPLIAALFAVIEQRMASPMLDLSLFRQRLFSAAAASAVANYICMYSVLFLMPFYLIQARGFDPAQAGVLLTAQPLLMALSAPLSGTLSDRIGSRLLGTLGMMILAVGAFFLSRLDLASSQAASVLATARNGGMVLGVGLAGAIFATVQAQSGGTIFVAISAGLLAAAIVSFFGALTSAVR